jgi:hypothetical protein
VRIYTFNGMILYVDAVGMRPGPHGVPVVSCGHADLDKMYGGGIPLGTLNLVSEDGWTSHHRYILQYFVSEGLEAGQVCDVNLFLLCGGVDKNKKKDPCLVCSVLPW